MTSWHRTSWHMTSWQMMAWHMTSWHMISWHMTSWHMTSWHMTSWHMTYGIWCHDKLRHNNATAAWSAAVVSMSRFLCMYLCICLSVCLLAPLFGLWFINVLIHLTQQVCVSYKRLTLKECPGCFPQICRKGTNSQGRCLNPIFGTGWGGQKLLRTTFLSNYYMKASINEYSNSM